MRTLKLILKVKNQSNSIISFLRLNLICAHDVLHYITISVMDSNEILNWISLLDWSDYSLLVRMCNFHGKRKATELKFPFHLKPCFTVVVESFREDIITYSLGEWIWWMSDIYRTVGVSLNVWWIQINFPEFFFFQFFTEDLIKDIDLWLGIHVFDFRVIRETNNFFYTDMNDNTSQYQGVIRVPGITTSKYTRKNHSSREKISTIWYQWSYKKFTFIRLVCECIMI